MSILRITDLNGIFLRDDFIFDPETEIGLDVTPAQGLYLPKWDGERWIEAMPQEEIDALMTQATPSEPTIEERQDQAELALMELAMIVSEVM